MKNVSDGDRYWLLERCPGVTEAQIEAFLERVAIIWCDGKCDDKKAREDAFRRVFCHE